MSTRKLSVIVICLFLTCCSYQQKQQIEDSSKNANVQSTFANITNLKKQILLTNSARFTNDRTLQGASGFLIKYKDANFAVTARHLLGEAGGVEPEVKINDLEKSLTMWKMMPRVVNDAAKETVELDAKGLDFSRSDSDIVLLKVLSKNFEIETLVPNFDLPSVGETLFLIGCPYSERSCKQNSYPVKYVEFDGRENALVSEITSNVELRGFSGAPLVNEKGEVVGLLVSSVETKGKNYILATHINEIQQIRF